MKNLTMIIAVTDKNADGGNTIVSIYEANKFRFIVSGEEVEITEDENKLIEKGNIANFSITIGTKADYMSIHGTTLSDDAKKISVTEPEDIRLYYNCGNLILSGKSIRNYLVDDITVE